VFLTEWFDVYLLVVLDDYSYVSSAAVMSVYGSSYRDLMGYMCCYLEFSSCNVSNI
jgi:hypothetical protein